MKVKCTSCGKTINIPDEKIPDGGVFNFSCPNCKAPQSAKREETSGVLPDLGEVPETTPTPRPLDETQDVPVPRKRAGIPVIPGMEDSIENELEVLGEGKYRALVVDNENMDRITPVLKKIQYVITSVKSHDEAINKLTFNTYDLLVLNERFEGCDPNNNPTHKFVEPMTMDTRRKMFVVMIGRNFKTMDNVTAFNRSVNMVMNETDFSNFELILKKSMNEYSNFYSVFKKMLIETGKEIG